MPQVLTVKVSIEIPRVPNFLRRTDGTMMELRDVEDAGLLAIAEQWGKNLIERAAQQRKDATNAR